MRARAQELGVVALFALGCGRLSGIDDYGPEDPKWGCLDRPRPEPAGPGPFNVTISPRLFDRCCIANVEVTLCRKTDRECLQPEIFGTTDEEGAVTLTIPGGFSGFIRLVKTDDTMLTDGRTLLPDLLPSYYYLNPPINSDQTIGVNMATAPQRDAFTRELPHPQHDERGLILVNAVDCTNTGVSGIVFESDGADDASTPFFSVNGLPNFSATATDASGFGGFVNVKAGPSVSLAARNPETGRTLGTLSVTVRAGAITQSRLVPSGVAPP